MVVVDKLTYRMLGFCLLEGGGGQGLVMQAVAGLAPSTSS